MKTKVYASKRGRPFIRWKDRVKEYMHKGDAVRGDVEQTRVYT